MFSIDQDGHERWFGSGSSSSRFAFWVLGARSRWPYCPCPTEPTTLRAASPIVSAVVKFRPLSRSIRLPISTLVPSIRMTIGTRHAELLHRGNHAFGEHVAAQDAAEDVDQHRLDVLVRHQDLERVADLLGIGAAADVEEVRRLAARQLDDVHRRHREAGAVDHAADRAVEPDVVQRELRRLDLERILLAEIAQVA